MPLGIDFGGQNTQSTVGNKTLEDLLKLVAQAGTNIDTSAISGGTPTLKQRTNVPLPMELSTLGLQGGAVIDEKKLNPIELNDLKTVKKFRSKQIEGAMEQGVPAESILETAGIPMSPTQDQTKSGILPGQPSGQPSGQFPISFRDPQNLLTTGGASFDPKTGGVDVQRGGFINRLLQALGGTNNINQDLDRIAALQKITGQVPLQKGEKEKLKSKRETEGLKILSRQELESFKQDRLDQREVLKSQLTGSEEDDISKASQLTVQSLNNLATLRNKITFKGPLLGGLGAVGGSIGLGTSERAEFESATQQAVFDIGRLLGQKGRAFTEKEQELVRKKIMQASLMAKHSDFVGRTRAIVKRINGIAGEEMFSVDKKGTIGVKGIKQTLPGTRDVSKTPSGNTFRRVE